MSGMEVGGWFASAFLGILVEKVRSYINYQYESKSGIKQKLRSLERDLTKIQTILHEADKRSIENQALKNWLRDLKDASYDVEDVLDMFEYRTIKDMVEETSSNQVNSLNLFKKAHSAIRSLGSSNLNDLTGVVDRFNKIVVDMAPLTELVLSQPINNNLKVFEKMKWRETSSTPTETELFGRRIERSNLMKLLLEMDSDEGVSSSKNVHVLPIIGMGGVGKTTIAQDVYNDEDVKNHFDLMAWVCVSDDFDVKRLGKEIIESASIQKPHDFHNLQNFDRIHDILKQGLSEKRFLIVLDDIWNEVVTKWEKLLSVLNIGKAGSRVIVTTQSQKIASMMGTKKAITLGGLESKEFWNFFAHCAFGDENPANHTGLISFGKQIVKKLGGNPLAAKTVGAVLKSNLSFHHWKEVCASKLWQNNQQEDGIMSMLKLSYEYLPSHLKQCFVYCCLFSKGYRLSKEKLTQMWMAHGFLKNEENNMEKIGQTYIDELLSRSFLQKYFNRYVIHDLLHDLGQYLSNGEIFIADDREVKVPDRVRHISIYANNLSLVCNDKYAKKNLRSLVILDCYEKNLDMLKELRCLRVLVIKKFGGKLSSESFHKMLHLRYLEMEGYPNRYSHMLPKSLGKLYHLQVLNAGQRWGNDDSRCVLPKEINSLINLRHLKASMGGVARVGTLTSLQELSFYVKQKESGFEIGQLRNMLQLRRLHMKGLASVESKEQASEVTSENKEHLEDLELEWGDDHNNPNLNNFVGEVLECLRPHKNLEKLVIKGYKGKCPSWFYENWVSNLNRLTLCRCSKWEILPPLGQLPFLKFLSLERMDAVKSVGPEFYGRNNNTSSSTIIFPSLESLTFKGMLALTEWYKDDLFPRLSYLSIVDCPQLRLHGSQTDNLLYQIRRLTVQIMEDQTTYLCANGLLGDSVEISCLNFLMLTEWVPCDNLASVEVLKIKSPRMINIPTSRELEEWFQHLSSLRELCFWNCFELESLPSNLINNLSTLRNLSFEWCPKIKSLPEEGLPTFLQVLHISGCENIKSLPEKELPTSLQVLDIQLCSKELRERCRKDEGPDWHKIANIPTVRINGRLVDELRSHDDVNNCESDPDVFRWALHLMHIGLRLCTDKDNHYDDDEDDPIYEPFCG